jgi:F0F1-type ATP synthase alpha subunit
MRPSPKAFFDTLVPQMLIRADIRALAQSYASEQSARMSAMERATDNADNMLSRLNNQYNTARQFAITQEISEIASAAKRLTGGLPMARTGKIIKISGPVLDVMFDGGEEPEMHRLLRVTDDTVAQVHMEVVAHITTGVCAALLWRRRRGFYCGLSVVDLERTITVPVGTGVLGRAINVLGEPIDKCGPIEAPRAIPYTTTRQSLRIRCR